MKHCWKRWKTTKAKIEKLELEQQQQFECDRQSRLLVEKKLSSVATTSIEMATPMIRTSGSFGSGSGTESRASENEDSPSGSNVDSSGGGNSRMQIDDEDGNDSTPPASTPNITTCMECNLIPTHHTCLKCKQVQVCSVCCDTNRGLQNNPWCKTCCFENETPASKAMIRNGNNNVR